MLVEKARKGQLTDADRDTCRRLLGRGYTADQLTHCNLTLSDFFAAVAVLGEHVT